MRHIPALLIFTVCLLAVSSGAPQRITVVDCFNMTVAPENAIVMKDGRWFLGTTDGVTVSVSVVDIENGFIRIEKGKDGWLEAALFFKNDGTPILVMSMKMLKGSLCSVEDSVQVFEISEGVAVETASLLPKLPMDPFFKEGFDFFDKKKIGDFAHTVRISYRLPRKGADIQATMDMACFDWVTGRDGGAGADMSPEDKMHIRNFIEGIKCKVIDIKWDMEKGRFVVDDACR
ncbi:MAG TPA: hypothetical protein PLM53_12935 [Spirochaetota bacterium]|nr:hypothetical protein [Spirochaetota bacterium]HPC40706.1 hypothetical protein [Spirochaetota bacterium]HPL18916.1 hypothetical protein [Spirochaetota bacterium]HQF09386.1 hypothetical protein [Spirochaetota bacterium]HQH98000.1 hypothetical protein [Spirochaetota bacterium]